MGSLPPLHVAGCYPHSGRCFAKERVNVRSGFSFWGPYNSDLLWIDPLCLPNPLHSHGEALFQLIHFQWIIVLVNNLRIGSDINSLFIDDDESATLRNAVNRSKERKGSLLLPLREPQTHEKHCHHQENRLIHEKLFELHHQLLKSIS